MYLYHHVDRARVAATLLLMLGMLFAMNAGASAAPDRVERVAGDDRVDTAIQVSQELWDTAGTVVLARADDFPDALAAGPLAGFADAPILLTGSRVLDERVATEISRLGADRVYLIGGDAALSENVEDAVADLAEPVRLSGTDRYGTADAIADEIAEYRETGLGFSAGAVVSGTTFPDALAAMNVPGFTGDGSDAGPDYISLTGRDSLPGDDRVCDPSYPDLCVPAPPPDLNCDDLGFIGPSDIGVGFAVTGSDPHRFDADDDGTGCENWSPFPVEERHTIVGGEAAVSGNVERQLSYSPGAVDRIAGSGRYETAAAALEAYLDARGDAPAPLFVATGAAFPDALAGGAAVAEVDGYLALVSAADVPGALAAVLTEHADAFTTVYVLGGEDAVTADVEARLAALLGVS